MGIRRKIGSSKNPPTFSQEFFIQNHADIVSVFAMIFLVGFMFQWTSKYASMFVTVQHNITRETNDSSIPEVWTYTSGPRDVCTVFFYLLISIIAHAIIQEYVLDKLNRKMHLSKVKHSKFNESGQLLVFYLASIIYGADLLHTEGYLFNISKLWETYPQTEMQLKTKFFFICQMAYWIHILPELYFQKIKKDEMGNRIIYASLYFVFISAAYLLNLTGICLCLILVHYVVEASFHFARLMYFSERADISIPAFTVWFALFLVARFVTLTLAFLTFWFGMKKLENQELNVAEGNFNTPLIRLFVLMAVCSLQAWLMWNFISFHMKRRRETPSTLLTKKKVTAKAKDKKALKKKKDEKEDSEDDSFLPEADQQLKDDAPTTTTTVKLRKPKKTN